ncbi:MAG: glycosyltransferase family 1 protein [Chthoniobacterales bacterium]
MVLLIGNYPPDQQQSMLRFGTMMLEGLTAAGVSAELIQPEPIFGNFRLAGAFVAKWLAYIDKFVLFPLRLRARLRATPALVHICDHSNARYAQQIRGPSVVITCHDFLAVRGALGEETDTPASATGRWLQRWILAGLRKADALACDSQATLEDARKLVVRGTGRPTLHLILLGLSHPYQRMKRAEALAKSEEVTVPFVLHVGSNLRRKNREAVLRIFASCRAKWDGQLVFVGERLSDSLNAEARELGIADRIVQLGNCSNEKLEALYNCATALVYPSRFEGFGWPIIEAQACGCPVVCSSLEPMAEIAGAGALLHHPDDEAGFAQDLLRLTDAAEHADWSARALKNAQRFTTERMIANYRELYRELSPAC